MRDGIEWGWWWWMNGQTKIRDIEGFRGKNNWNVERKRIARACINANANVIVNAMAVQGPQN